ncbi:glycoside hydrolase family 99-like domain-containing protein [Calidifontibacter terrae]
MAPRTVAFYLPQFHQIPENDEWWGEGFTEWVNVERAKPLFVGHDHPRKPTDLGKYDLSDGGGIHREQTLLARQYGIDAFCKYFYWFEGHRLLEKPLDIWRNDSSLLPYCLCWANEPWSRRWDGRSHDVLMPQSYPAGYETGLFDELLPHLRAPHYLRQDGRPILLVHRADLIPKAKEFSARLRALATAAGLPGLYLIASETITDIAPAPLGFDAVAEFPPVGSNTLKNALVPAPPGLEAEFRGRLLSYPRIVARFTQRGKPTFTRHRGVMPRWDNTARRGTSATVYVGDTPELYRQWLSHALADEESQRGSDGLVFINAWNEWAEAAYLEPDAATGRSYLEATKAARALPALTTSSGRNLAYTRSLTKLAAGSTLNAWRRAQHRANRR